MAKSTTIDRTARARLLVAAAHQAREEWLAAPKGSLEKKSLAISALNAIFIAQDAAGAVLDYSDDEIADLVTHIDLRAQAGDPVRYNGERGYADLLDAGRIVLCSNGTLAARDD